MNAHTTYRLLNECIYYLQTTIAGTGLSSSVSAYILCPKDNPQVFYAIDECRNRRKYIRASDDRKYRMVPLTVSGVSSDGFTVDLAPLGNIEKPVTVNIKVFNVIPSNMAEMERYLDPIYCMPLPYYIPYIPLGNIQCLFHTQFATYMLHVDMGNKCVLNGKW